jgi:hypothetical protein
MITGTSNLACLWLGLIVNSAFGGVPVVDGKASITHVDTAAALSVPAGDALTFEDVGGTGDQTELSLSDDIIGGAAYRTLNIDAKGSTVGGGWQGRLRFRYSSGGGALTEAMVVTKEGPRFLLSSLNAPANNSEAAIVLTDDTHLKFSVKGSDGTVRDATLPLSTAAVSSQSGTSYTAVMGDAGTYIQFTSASAVTFTIPPHASVAFPVGTVIEFEQNGAGAVTVAPGSSVIINSRGSDLTLAGQYAVAALKKVATNVWTLTGDL